MSAPTRLFAQARLCEELARRCRSGRALRTAIGELPDTGSAPIDATLAEVRAALAAGAPLSVAEALFAAEPGAAAGWALAASGAADPAAALGGAAAGLYERHALAEEVRALTAGARWSAVVIALLPLAFGAWAAATDPRVLGVLAGEPVGQVCLALGVALDALGAWWMRRLVRGCR
ncbi:MAG: type II secretion system F family protein [Acidimicrobiales bacterium]